MRKFAGVGCPDYFQVGRIAPKRAGQLAVGSSLRRVHPLVRTEPRFMARQFMGGRITWRDDAKSPGSDGASPYLPALPRLTRLGGAPGNDSL